VLFLILLPATGDKAITVEPSEAESACAGPRRARLLAECFDIPP